MTDGYIQSTGRFGSRNPYTLLQRSMIRAQMAFVLKSALFELCHAPFYLEHLVQPSFPWVLRLALCAGCA